MCYIWRNVGQNTHIPPNIMIEMENILVGCSQEREILLKMRLLKPFLNLLTTFGLKHKLPRYRFNNRITVVFYYFVVEILRG